MYYKLKIQAKYDIFRFHSHFIFLSNLSCFKEAPKTFPLCSDTHLKGLYYGELNTFLHRTHYYQQIKLDHLH